VFFCFVIVLWIARRNEQLGLEFEAGAIGLLRQTGDQFHLHQIEQGLGDTMFKTNTLSMAVFALLVNSTVLLSLSM
jgi:hypothetical protein